MGRETGNMIGKYIEYSKALATIVVAGLAVTTAQGGLVVFKGEEPKTKIEPKQLVFVPENTDDKLVSVYKVKMHSWIGPDHADQSQIHQILKYDDSETHHVTVKTKNYPYSETFNVLQVWEFKRLSDTELHVKMSSGIDWIDPPMSIIRSNIESSITKGQKANAQQFSK